MKQAVGYIRVSTEEQGKSGFGIQSQKATIRAIAKANGYNLGHLGKSSWRSTATDKRPKLQEAMQAARRRRRPLIVVSWDRLSRDAIEIETIVTESRIEIIDGVVGHNADPLSYRRKRPASPKKRRCYLSGPARGYFARSSRARNSAIPATSRGSKKGAAATKRNAEIRDAEISSIILRSRGRPLSEVAAELNRAGLRTARGKPSSKANLRRARQRIERTAAQREQNELTHLESPHWGIF